MLRIESQGTARFCDGFRRRDFLHAGTATLAGLTLPQFLTLQAEGAVKQDRDINCVMIFMLGGPSQLDTWDLKPNAPEEIRGPYRPIETNVPGVRISEIFPRMARHADKYALVRSVYHTAAAVHDTGHQMMQTGRLFQGGIEHPHPGCVMSSLKGARGAAPAHVVLPTPMGPTGGNLPHGQSAGYLGKQFDPLLLNADPSKPDFKVQDLLPPDYLTSVRRERRQALRDAVDTSIRKFEASANAKLVNTNFQQAYALMSSREARDAFDVRAEPEPVRQKYGMNKFGQSCLLARRMLERGVRFVTINMFETVFNEITWDIHGSRPFTPIQAYRDSVGPWFDNGYSTLLEELSTRGMLSNTLVVAMGEFGRTPKVNPAGGRDHWPQCWSIIFAGAGVKGGQVVGASDEIGAYPKDRPVTPAEVAASVYHALGMNLHHELPGPQGRPIPLVDNGVQPITELF
jgi:hypothetical protein